MVPQQTYGLLTIRHENIQTLLKYLHFIPPQKKFSAPLMTKYPLKQVLAFSELKWKQQKQV